MRVRRAPGMRPGAFLTLVRPAPKLAPPRCSRVCRAVKREAGRVLRTEIANLRCPRNGKRPRRMTQAGSGAFRVQVARGRGPLRVKRAGRRAGTPPARIPAEARSLHGFMTRGLRGSGARSASRDLSSMLTPIVRPALGRRRGVPLAAVAQAAAYADPSGAATSHVKRRRDPSRGVLTRHCRRKSPLPSRSCSTVTRARRRSTRWGGFHYIAQNVGRANVRLDGSRPCARPSARLCRVGSTDAEPAATSRDARGETRIRGADRRTRYRASMAASRAFGCAWRLSRAHNDSGGTRCCDDGVVNPAARDDDASCTV